MKEKFEIRPKPRKGTVLRVQLSDGYYYYTCQATSISLWLYSFRTAVPAHGTEFFDRRYWKWGLKVGELSSNFVNCGLLKLEGLEYTYTPKRYKIITKEEAARRGYLYNTVVTKSWDTLETREVTPEEIYEKGYGLDRWMEEHYEEVISQYIPQMELREVPPQFIDKRDPDALKEAVKKPAILTVRVTLREEEMFIDELELEIEEPLAEALEDAQCGSFASSGTEPGGLFSIDFTTSSANRSKCLKVIERTLKKLGCPESTTVEVLED